MIRSSDSALRNLLSPSLCEAGRVAPVSLTLTVIATDPTRRAVEEALAPARDRYMVKVVQAPDREVRAQIQRVYSARERPPREDVEVVLRAGARSAAETCPFCQSTIGSSDPSLQCRLCGVVHHRECWLQNGGCTTLGCALGPAPVPSRSVVPLAGGPAAETGPTDADELRGALRSSLCESYMLAPVSLTLAVIAADATSPVVDAALGPLRARYRVKVTQASEEDVHAQIERIYRAPASPFAGLEVVLAADTKVVGRTCPYCQTTIKPRAEVISCARCGVSHHAECWRRNSGCTTFGCSAARPEPRPLPRFADPEPIQDHPAWRYTDGTTGIDLRLLWVAMVVVAIIAFWIMYIHQNGSDTLGLSDPNAPSHSSATDYRRAAPIESRGW